MSRQALLAIVAAFVEEESLTAQDDWEGVLCEDTPGEGRDGYAGCIPIATLVRQGLEEPLRTLFGASDSGPTAKACRIVNSHASSRTRSVRFPLPAVVTDAREK